MINFTDKQVLLIARNSARAIAELHTLGIIHGDLTKENILVDLLTNDVKITDFDLATHVEAWLMQQVILNSPVK